MPRDAILVRNMPVWNGLALSRKRGRMPTRSSSRTRDTTVVGSPGVFSSRRAMASVSLTISILRFSSMAACSFACTSKSVSLGSKCGLMVVSSSSSVPVCFSTVMETQMLLRA